MKEAIRNALTGSPAGDQGGIILLVFGIVSALAFFGCMIYDAWRIRRRIRQFQGRHK